MAVQSLAVALPGRPAIDGDDITLQTCHARALVDAIRAETDDDSHCVSLLMLLEERLDIIDAICEGKRTLELPASGCSNG